MSIDHLTKEEKDVIRASIGMKYRLSKHIKWREVAVLLLEEKIYRDSNGAKDIRFHKPDYC